MGFLKTAAQIGMGALKVTSKAVDVFSESLDKQVQQYEKDRDIVSRKSDAMLLHEMKTASGTRHRAIVDELSSRGYGKK